MNKLEPEDFREMKANYSGKLEAKLSSQQKPQQNINSLLDQGLQNLLELQDVEEKGDTEHKRKVINPIFPEKMHFKNNSLRTGRVNEAARFIRLIDSDSDKNKNGTK